MNASITYFSGGGSVKYAKIRCGSVNLVVFSSSGRTERSAYFLADAGLILYGSLEIRGRTEQGLNPRTNGCVEPRYCNNDKIPILYTNHSNREVAERKLKHSNYDNSSMRQKHVGARERFEKENHIHTIKAELE